MASPILRLLQIILFAVFPLSGCSQSDTKPVELAYYQLSGGIAGKAISVEIGKDGATSVSQQGINKTIELDAASLTNVEAVLGTVPEGLFMEEKPEQAECCDQISEELRYLERYINLDAMEPALYTQVRALFDGIVEQAFPAEPVDQAAIQSVTSEG